MNQVKQVYLVMDNGDLIIPNVDSHKKQEFEIERTEPHEPWFDDHLGPYIPNVIRWSGATLNLKLILDEKENYTIFHDAADTFNEGVSEYLGSKIKQLETIKEKLD